MFVEWQGTETGEENASRYCYRPEKVPMPGVTVKISGTSVSTATNVNGQFSLNFTHGERSLEFSFVGV